jgi:hypothetical protein
VERHFSEAEVAQVIRRAAELQERLAPSDSPRPHGMAERELVRIAGELGLEERFVMEAISDSATFAVGDKGGLGSLDRTLERTAAGLPGSKAFEIALDEFGPSVGIQSGPTTVGDTMTYQSMVGLSHCEMLVNKVVRRTRVKVGVSTFLPIIAVALPALLAVGVIGGVVGEQLGPAIGWTVGLIGVLADFFVTKRVIRWSNMKVVEKLEGLVARLNGEAGKVSQDGDGG